MGVSRLALGAAAAAVLTLSACESQQETGAAPGAGRGGGRGGAEGPVPVTTATVLQKAMPLQISIIGTAEPVSTVSILVRFAAGEC